MNNQKINIRIKSFLIAILLLLFVLPPVQAFSLFGNKEGHFELVNSPHYFYEQFQLARDYSVVKLKNGKVLITSYSKKIEDYKIPQDNFECYIVTDTLKPAELYNPETRKFELTGNQNVSHYIFFSSISLENGKVLILGNYVEPPFGKFKSEANKIRFIDKDPKIKEEYERYCKDYENSMYAELYDLETGKFEYTGKLNIRSWSPLATLLKDGRVFVIGNNIEGKSSKTAEIYDPETGKFSLAAKLEAKSDIFKILTLDDGRVFILLGHKYTIYNPETNEYSPVNDLLVNRVGSEIVKLLDGRVLILGGEITNIKPGTTFQLKNGMRVTVGYEVKWTGIQYVEVYDPKTDKVSIIGELNYQHGDDQEFEATLLKDGRVLVTGGITRINHNPFPHDKLVKSAEIFDPKTGISKKIGNTKIQRSYHQAILLDDGSVLIIGGNKFKKSAELFIPKK